MSEILSEINAIHRAKKGEPSAQRYLYDQYRSKWFMICLRYLPNRADAEDALQNGLVNIFTKINQFDTSIGEFSHWTSRIIANECIQILRKINKNQMVGELKDDLPAAYREESAIDKISRQEIMSIIQKLPAGYRVIFNMYVFDGFTHKEIASQLNISEGTSKSQLSKARKMLQQSLEVMI